ncbi:M16 family metallopeptidase [Streptomyces mirabilis]|uniref:M16 family metallopeptidase n=1 Tax=Streptomyces mirabilis TaxID=68239 RepID=UPI0033172A9E
MSTSFAERPVVRATDDYMFPTPSQWTLDNGLTVYHFPTAGRMIFATVVSRPGVNAESRDRGGVATLLSRLRREGTAAFPGEEFLSTADGIGASLQVEADSAAQLTSISVPETELLTGLALLADSVIAPVLAEADLTRVRGMLLDELRFTRQDPTMRAQQEHYGMCFGERDRFSEPYAGSERTIPQITREDTIMFHQAHSRPEHTTLIVGGRCDTEVLRRLVEDAFSTWQAGDIRRQGDGEPGTGQPKVMIVDRPGAAQTAIQIGGLICGPTDHRWARLQVAKQVLAGSMHSRLNALLREEKGYTYGVRGRLTPVAGRGILEITTAVDTLSTGAALDDLVSTLTDLASNGISEEEWRRARHELLRGAALQYETASALVNKAADAIQHELPVDSVNHERRAIAAVTADEAAEAFAEAVSVKQPYLALVGDATEIEPAVRTLFNDSDVSVETR